MSDIDELFSRLKTSQRRDSPDSKLWENHMPTQTQTATPPRQIMPRGATEQTMSNNLLTLLNIRPETQRNPSASSDALRAASTSTVLRPDGSTFGKDDATEPPANTQRFLLDLLTKPKGANEKATSTAGSAKAASTVTAAAATAPAHTAAESLPPAELPQTPTDKITLAPNRKFNYVNPFDQLHASSPLKLPQEPQEKSSVAERLETTHQEVVKHVDRVLKQVVNAQDVLEAANDDEKTKPFESDYTTVPETTPESKDWSTAEDEAAKDDVVVYNFPMQPFVTIELKGEARAFPKSTWAATTPIARLKKDFSHDDRVLAAASQSHIVYAVSSEKKPAGLKVIQQDDGKNKQIWSGTERICSVQINGDAVLATGVDGTIFYTELTDLDADMEGFHMSPPPNSDEQTSSFATSSAIRTRAKLGPQLAVARGRQIHLFDIEQLKQLAHDHVVEPVLKTSINTGKAGKDFCFSEDGTVLASLDKLGKIKFWQLPVQGELTEPLHSVDTLQERPTSIMFIDKDRAYSKKVALRYVLVGFQQNHVLQLWDLGLGQCVQELRLPPSDMLCSVSYHPKTAMIIVGHPGRDSIYFLHLSCPKYNITGTQAAYIQSLPGPRPESTAIMSGVREFAFTPGQLRSIDVLKSETIEMYVMHSKGVIAVPISKEELGLDAKGKVQRPADAVKAGVAIINNFEQPMSARKIEKLPAREEQKVNAPPAYTPLAQSIAVAEKALPPAYVPKERTRSASFAAVTSGKSQAASSPAPTNEPVAAVSKQVTRPAAKETPPVTIKPQDELPAATPAPTAAMTSLPPTHMSDQAMADQFAGLYGKLEGDRRVAEAAATARQDAMLRLVSATLTDNVEQSLHKIVSTSIAQQVLPALSTQVITNADRSLKGLPVTVQQQVKASLPDAVRSAVDAVVPRIISELSKTLDDEIQQAISSQTRQLTAMISAQLDQRDSQSNEKVVKALQESEQRVTELLAVMQSQQAQFAERLETLRPAEPTPVEEIKEEEVEEVQHLTSLLNSGSYEQATIEWLQSPNQALFDDLFVRINPAYLQHVSPLIALSVSVAVTGSFDHNVEKRLEWLSAVLQMDLSDPEIRDVVPKIMDVLVQRLQGAYMQIAEADGSVEVLRKVVQLNRHISGLRKGLY